PRLKDSSATTPALANFPRAPESFQPSSSGHSS
ncbi:uncharacterized protein METZ01_LOCUS426673, partial [marine metagenome]